MYELPWSQATPGHLFVVARCASDRAWPTMADHAGADISLHDSATGGVLARLRAGGGVLYALAFSPSGACLLGAGSEALVHAFHCPAGTKRAVLRTVLMPPSP